MRKRELELINEMIHGLATAHEEIYGVLKNCDNSVKERITILLTECQNLAINMGTLIEQTEGESFVTVSYLEEYCDLVFNSNEEIQNSENVNVEKINKKINRMLQKIENSVKHDIPLRREAVFLPYKASMWDSLESVWEAADADPNCDAYVIPIPYFEKNPDGTFKEMHWEGELFPEYVPITKYEEFDFGKHHPDMIFIHNPYDEYNFVTSIHPFFYSEKLKAVTDCLVYIPYFATSGGMGEARKLLPVYLNVDYIVIQHESFRKFYDKNIPNSKFVALGSPKFDSVIQKCKEPIMPETWIETVGNRRVYFYNTSLQGMIDDTELFLKKMKYVFSEFEGRNDVCIIWRPHPLFEETLKAIRPTYYDEYLSVKNSFFELKNGILDETADVENTIANSDVYIGDEKSSITALFGVVGKPLYILDLDIDRKAVESDKEKYIQFIPSKTFEGQTEIYSLAYGNNVYKFSDKFGYKYVGRVDSSNELYKYRGVILYREKLVAVPYMSQEIKIIDNDKSIIIELAKENTNGAFRDYYIYDDYLVLIPWEYSSLVRINLDSYSVEYLSGISNFARDTNGMSAYWINETDILCLSGDCRQLLKVDKNCLETQIIETGLVEKYIYAETIEPNVVCLLPKEGTRICFYDYKKQCARYIDVKNVGIVAYDRLNKVNVNEFYFDSIGVKNNKIIIAPSKGNMFVEIDYSKMEAKEFATEIRLDMDGNEKYCQHKGVGRFYRTPYGFEYVCFSNGKNYRIGDNGLVENKIEYPCGEAKSIGYGALNNRPLYCCFESALDTLKDELDGKNVASFDKNVQLKRYESVNASIDGTAGKKIYTYIKHNVDK